MAQQIKTYKGGNIDQKFRDDATRLNREGWTVQSQSYGGLKRQGCLSFLTFGTMGSRKAKELTVVYTKPD